MVSMSWPATIPLTLLSGMLLLEAYDPAEVLLRRAIGIWYN
jgi:hypothetical protein